MNSIKGSFIRILYSPVEWFISFLYPRISASWGVSQWIGTIYGLKVVIVVVGFCMVL